MRNKTLNAKQMAFCREYMVDRNGSQAAIRAGYSAKTARQHAQKLLTKPDIRAEIARREKKVELATGLTVESVVATLQEICEKATMEGQYSAAARAAELLGKHIGMWREQVTVNHNHRYVDVPTEKLEAAYRLIQPDHEFGEVRVS